MEHRALTAARENNPMKRTCRSLHGLADGTTLRNTTKFEEYMATI